MTQPQDCVPFVPGHPPNVSDIRGQLEMTEGVNLELIQLFDGRFNQLSRKIDEGERKASESRRDVHQKLETQGRDLIEIKHRLTTVESAVEEGKPTLEEFRTIKYQIQGGGKLTKLLWIIGIPLIGSAFWIVLKWQNVIMAIKALNGK